MIDLCIQKGDKKSLIKYNSVNPTFIWDEGELFIKEVFDIYNTLLPNHVNKPEVRLVLGRNCNYKCSYCIQSNECKDSKVQPNLKNLVNKIHGIADEDYVVNFWGGEPLLYFDYIKELVELFKNKNISSFAMVTNGSLITDEIATFLINNNFNMAISHDAQGQNLRSGDPFKSNLKVIKRLVSKLDGIGFIPVITKDNCDHTRIVEYYTSVFNKPISLMEALPLTIVDNNSSECSISNQNLDIYSNRLYNFLLNKPLDEQPFVTYLLQEKNFIRNLISKTVVPSFDFCPGSKQDTLKIDINGNLLDCHNFDYNIELPYTTWVNRDTSCNTCPVLQFCKGGCPYQKNGEYHKQTCKTKLHHYSALLGHVVTLITDGWILTNINYSVKEVI